MLCVVHCALWLCCANVLCCCVPMCCVVLLCYSLVVLLVVVCCYVILCYAVMLCFVCCLYDKSIWHLYVHTYSFYIEIVDNLLMLHGMLWCVFFFSCVVCRVLLSVLLIVCCVLCSSE